MRKILIFLILILIFTTQIKATEIMDQQAEQFGVDTILDGMPQSAADQLEGGISPNLNFVEEASEILSNTVSQSGVYVRASVSLLLKILLILILCRLVETDKQSAVSHAVSLAGVLSLTLCCAADLKTMIGLGRKTMDELMDFSTLLLPVMASAAVATGATTGAGVLYGVAAVFSKILIGVCGKILMPMVYAFLALGVVDASLQEARLSKMREFLAWLIKWSLKIVMYAFTGFLAVSGVLAGSVDGAVLKAAKVTISGVVPVVGGIISDAAETILHSAGILKGAVGTFGMLAFLAIFLSPFLRMGLHYLTFRFTSVLGGVMGSSLCEYMECITTTMGFLLAMLGSCVLMCLLSCCCFVRMSGL